MNKDIRLIATDLDGTLLNSRKELTPRTLRAIKRAAEAGIEFVPATGRFYRGCPEELRKLPFIRYAVVINGACVYDVKNDSFIHRTDIPAADAVRIFDIVKNFPAEYECYAEGWGYAPEDLAARIDEFTESDFARRIVKTLRTTVSDLSAYVTEHFDGVHKVQMFTDDKSVLAAAARAVHEVYPDYLITHALDCNLEINSPKAGKGNALKALASHLGLSMDQVMVFGDGNNDISMLKAAGCGVAMANAMPEVKAVADRVTLSCDEEGVAAAIEELLGM